jgi:hypothetical protein
MRSKHSLGALIKKYKLSTAEKYTVFRARHPELNLPTANSIMRVGVKALDAVVSK